VNSLSGAASTTVPTAFQGLWNAIQNNPPFGFIFQIKAQLDSLSATGTPTTTLDLPTFEVNDIFSPFDTGLAGIMYLVFAVWLIKRFAHFEF
ncbi:MAG: hypothetical protein KGJ13_12460, partial [Patescibacteria group bacterium]|nr:hypothetical protein [Patescibacteria group bacterium]